MLRNPVLVGDGTPFLPPVTEDVRLDGDACLGWWQFGSPDELPETKSRRRCEAGLAILARLAHRLLRHRQRVARPRCGRRRAGRRPIRHRRPRRRNSRGVPGGDRRSHCTGVVPAASVRWPPSKTTASRALRRFTSPLGSHPHRRRRRDLGVTARCPHTPSERSATGAAPRLHPTTVRTWRVQTAGSAAVVTHEGRGRTTARSR